MAVQASTRPPRDTFTPKATTPEQVAARVVCRLLGHDMGRGEQVWVDMGHGDADCQEWYTCARCGYQEMF